MLQNSSCSTRPAVRGTVKAFVPSRVPACVKLSQSSQRHVRNDVRVAFFKFGKNGVSAEEGGIVGSQGRDDFDYDDVEQYFNYMGFLAEEGTYDRMEAMLKSGLHPIDVILLLAASENDTPKIQEILRAGANPNCKNLEGKKPVDLASKPEVISLLKEYGSRVPA